MHSAWLRWGDRKELVSNLAANGSYCIVGYIIGCLILIVRQRQSIVIDHKGASGGKPRHKYWNLMDRKK